MSFAPRLGNLLGRIAYEGGLHVRFGLDIADDGRELWNLFVDCPDGTCNRTGEPAPWKGRKWRLSPHMTDGEVVGTAFKAILTALEHEARELFKFDGQPVFDSHVDIHKLVALHRDEQATIERSPL